MATEAHNALLNFLLPHAHQLLEKYGEFYPFAAEVGLNGEVSLSAAMPGDDHPPSQVVIDMLMSVLQPKLAAGEIAAFSICLDSRLTLPGAQPKDAICCRIWAISEEPLAVYEPYTVRSKFLSKRKDVSYGDIVATAL